jgi:hypothetical protein
MIKYGVDKYIIFNRFTKIVNSYNRLNFYYNKNINTKEEQILYCLPNSGSVFYIGFCGKLYPGYNYYGEYYYTKDKIKEHFDFINYAKINDFFNININIDDLHIKYNTPILLFNYHGQIFKNISLKKYNFIKIKDMFTTYNDIMQYLSNELVNIKEIPEISDKDKIAKKGFDTKMGFRKRR